MQETNFTETGQSADAVPSDISLAPAPAITLCSYGNKLTREELARVATPTGTATHIYEVVGHVKQKIRPRFLCESGRLSRHLSTSVKCFCRVS